MAWETRILKTVNSQSVVNNTSSVTFTFQARNTSGRASGYNNYGNAYWNIGIENGASSGNVYFKFSWNYPKNEWFTIAEWTTTITHNDVGYWGANINAYVNTGISPRELKAFEWFSPPTIARKTTVYGFTNTMGGKQGFELNRASASFTHTLRYQFGSVSGTIGSDLGTTAEWNIPLSLANQVTNATQGSGTVFLDTYSGSTLIGTDSATFTLNVPTNVVPTIQSINVKEIETKNTLGVYVQGISRLNITLNSSGSYGSMIQSGKITVDGQTIFKTSGDTSVLRGFGNIVINATVTDTRGRIATKSMTIKVLEYSPPTLSNCSVIRNRNNPSQVNVIASGRVSSLMNVATEKNTLTYSIKYKQKTSYSYSTQQVVTSGLSFIDLLQTVQNIDITKSYDFKLCISDFFSESEYPFSVSTAQIIMDMSKQGLGINKYRENGALDVKGDIYADSINVTDSNVMNVNATNIYKNGNTVATENTLPLLSSKNGWDCYKFPNGLMIQSYQQQVSISYNTWLTSNMAFAYVPNFPDFAENFIKSPSVTCQCRISATEDCYMTMIVLPSVSNVGYSSNNKCGYINSSTQSLQGQTKIFTFYFTAIGRWK